MSDEHTLDRDDGTPLAAEYVLGVLGAAERRDFERRLAQEPALRTEVEFWEQRLGAPRLRGQIGRSAAGKPGRGSKRRWAPARRTARAGRALAQPDVLALGRDRIGGGRRREHRRAGRRRTARAGADQPLVAKLDVSGGQAGFVAAIDPARNGLTIVPASVTNLNQRVLELWLIAPGDKPRSLGLIEPGRAIHINLPAESDPAHRRRRDARGVA